MNIHPENLNKNNDIENLIAEDSLTQAEQLKYILEEAGYLVSVANNGKEALSSISKHKPTLVISDIIMPEMDGYQLCEHMKKEEKFRDIPVILLTALSDPTDIIKGLDCGADHFITKPYDEKYLISCIQYILANWELRKGQETGMGMEILIGGQKHFITSDRLQIVHLLISTYEAAIQQNRELIRAQDELRALNGQLEKKVGERTADLVEEIEERKRIAEALMKSEERFRSLVETISDWIWGVDENAVYTYASPQVKDILGYEPCEVVGKTPFDLMPADEAERVAKLFLDISQTRRTFEHLENVNQHKDGRLVVLERSGVPILDTNGKFRGYRGVDRDITKRKQVEDTLHKSEKELKKRVEELEQFYQMAVGRELKMKELKEEIERLNEELEKYKNKLDGFVKSRRCHPELVEG